MGSRFGVRRPRFLSGRRLDAAFAERARPASQTSREQAPGIQSGSKASALQTTPALRFEVEEDFLVEEAVLVPDQKLREPRFGGDVEAGIAGGGWEVEDEGGHVGVAGAEGLGERDGRAVDALEGRLTLG